MGRIFEKRKHSIFKTAAQNSKLYSKYSKQLYMAAKNGVPDPHANPVLRTFVERAKKENVPSHVIEKAIQKASEYARAADMILGKPISVSDYSSADYQSGSRNVMAKAAPAMMMESVAIAELPSGELEITSTVSVVFELK